MKTRDVRVIKQIENFNITIAHVGIDRRSYLRCDNPPISNYGLFCIFDGKGQYVLNGKSFPISKGDVVFIPRGMVYTTISDEDAPFKHYYICFSGPDCKSIISRMGFSVNEPVIHTGSDYVRKKLANIFNVLEYETFNSTMKANILLFEIFYYFFEKNKENDSLSSEKNKYVRMAENIIQEKYNKGITVDMIARTLKLNRTYLSTLFSTIKGISIKQYILEHKISEAKKLICSGKMTMLQIAHEVGFNDSVNFYRQFKKATHVSPKVFQRQIRQDLASAARDRADTLRQKKEYDKYQLPPPRKNN